MRPHGRSIAFNDAGRTITPNPSTYEEVVQPIAPAIPSNLPVEAAATSSLRVLLVEDEPMVRELGASLLSRLGYDVLVASNGRQALNLIHADRSRTIHALVTDVVMPELGGKDLADSLRIISPQTKVIFCSGYTEDVASLRGEAGAPIVFIPKPYTMAVLARKVREVLDS